MGGIFSTEGPVMRALTDIMNLLILNILTLVMSIPVITAGAALTALHYVVMQMGEQEEGHIAGTYWKQFKLNLKSSLAPWLFILAYCLVLYLDYTFLAAGGWKWMMVPIYIGIFLLCMLLVWIFPLNARFENRFTAMIKNSFFLAVGYFPRTVAMILINFVITFVLTQVMSLLPLAVFFGISLPAYLDMFIYRSVIKKMVEQAS